MKKPLIEGEDYVFLQDGRLVFTAAYLLKRRVCCGNGCLNCPYDYINVSETKRATLLKQRQHEKQNPDQQGKSL